MYRRTATLDQRIAAIAAARREDPLPPPPKVVAEIVLRTVRSSPATVFSTHDLMLAADVGRGTICRVAARLAATGELKRVGRGQWGCP